MDKKLSKGYEKSPLLLQMVTAGVCACGADFLSYPFDTVKVRLQVQGENAFGKGKQLGVMRMVLTILQKEGVKSLYNGLTAGLQRQMVFSMVRIGLYDSIKAFYLNAFNADPNNLSIAIRCLAGITSAALGMCVAQPTDVVKIRFQASQVVGGKRRYKTVGSAYREILKTEGVGGLWKGLVPNICRNAICTISEVVVYDVVKDALLKYQFFVDGIHLHLFTGFIAGFITTVVSSPVDVVKTRYMNSPKGQYKGAIDCARQLMAKEGFAAYYKGFWPNFARLVTWNVLMWFFYEQAKTQIAKQYRDVDISVPKKK